MLGAKRNEFAGQDGERLSEYRCVTIDDGQHSDFSRFAQLRHIPNDIASPPYSVRLETVTGVLRSILFCHVCSKTWPPVFANEPIDGRSPSKDAHEHWHCLGPPVSRPSRAVFARPH